MHQLRNPRPLLVLLAACWPASATAAYNAPAVATAALAVAVRAEERVEHYDSGAVRARYTVDREGRKHGSYEEFYEDGTLALRAKYRKDELHGKYASFHPDGSEWITASYKSGALSGKYVERRADGRRSVSGVYKRGLREGSFLVRDDGDLVRTQEWKAGALALVDGVVVHPRTLEDVRATLERIHDPEQSWGGADAGWIDPPSGERTRVEPGEFEDNDRALRLLLAYRYLAGVEWEDVRVDARFNYHAGMGAQLLAELGGWTDDPTNPGWPKKLFRHAKLGIMGTNPSEAESLTAAVRQGMAQLGSGGVGYRTSFLDPQWMTTGFGRYDTQNLVWYDDESRRSPRDYETICFPPPGYVPADLFGPGHSWSCELNPGNHAPIAFKNDVSVEVYLLDEDWVRTLGPLELEFVDVYDRTIAFRPASIETGPGTRFEVRLPGIRHDKVGSALTYYVEFYGALEQDDERGGGSRNASGRH